MNRILGFALLFAVAAALPGSVRAGPAMTTANNSVSRDVDNAGGTYSSTANNQLTGSVAEEVVIATAATAANKLRGGFSTIAYYPGTIASLTVGAGVSASSASLSWPTPGYDGTLGPALGGSAYLIFVASTPVSSSINFNNVTVVVSTSGQSVGSGVGAFATGLYANTTSYAQVYLRDDDADVAYPFVTNSSTFVTLALAPSTNTVTLEFTQITSNTVTVAWIAPYQLSVASQTNEGYVLLASSNNFGALAPAGAPVFSSITYNVLDSTLTVGAGSAPLNLGSTYYFQVGSLNWLGQANYTTLTPLNFQISQSTGLINIAINSDVAISSVATSSVVITNVGNWPVTVQLTAVPVSGPWALGAARGAETAVLEGVFDPGPPAPAAAAFSTLLSATPLTAQPYPGNYAGSSSSYTGYQIQPGQSQTLWFYFQLPASTASMGPEVLSVVSQPLYP
jgi:hypothetical protein